MRIPVQMLGQSGCRLEIGGQVIYVDPYLSHSVQALDAPDLVRLLPIQMLPDNVADADWVLLTHEHIDHCDPHTIPKLAAASPKCQFIGPLPVIENLSRWGIAQERLHLSPPDWLVLSTDLELRSVLAAHPKLERCADGSWRYVGFLLRTPKGTLYLAGDTGLCDELIAELQAAGPIHTAFLPVNEINYFRNRRGIIGNMSVREAFGLAQELAIEQVVAVHWDMFAINEVYPEEIRLVHHKMGCEFNLLLNPSSFNLGRPKASVVVRTLNEARYLPALLEGISRQITNGIDFEVVLVDSGSTDDTLTIAERYGCRILHIQREDFSFGRSLNMGCEAAEGGILVITSGHCVPTDAHWLQALCQPLVDGHAQYSYGRQIGGPTSHYSECRVFEKYFGPHSRIPQDGFYCNNANAALLKAAWQRHNFDEELTGLEDMALGQQLVRHGGRLAYVANAVVYHHHTETWPQVKRRFEREAIALQQILPQVHVGLPDTTRYIISSIWRDWRQAARERVWFRQALNIVRYRYHQFTGSSAGNHQHRKLSHKEKEQYFYPS